MQLAKKVIGVIGGNGVAATNLLCHLIEEKLTAGGAFRDAHHPEMIIWQATQAPSRSMYLEGRGPSFIDEYVSIARKLKELGCACGCICCNTAHYALAEIEQQSGLPFINVIREVAFAARAAGWRSLEVFATDGSIRTGLYQKAFAAICPEIELLYPTPERQALVTKVICNVKNQFRFTPREHEENPTRILKSLLDSAAAPVILGCTDLRLASRGLEGEYALDSLECLADAIISKVQE